MYSKFETILQKKFSSKGLVILRSKLIPIKRHFDKKIFIYIV
jgi:hypothetical protein